eukprot:GFUD01036705.1.p1 GENE.GFUD01036705.1~~GFUD01036705.1.p1  ORF type:complete len:118 (-),score=13.02 GFUD01036705.1:150-503(-)
MVYQIVNFSRSTRRKAFGQHSSSAVQLSDESLQSHHHYLNVRHEPDDRVDPGVGLGVQGDLRKRNLLICYCKKMLTVKQFTLSRKDYCTPVQARGHPGEVTRLQQDPVALCYAHVYM